LWKNKNILPHIVFVVLSMEEYQKPLLWFCECRFIEFSCGFFGVFLVRK